MVGPEHQIVYKLDLLKLMEPVVLELVLTQMEQMVQDGVQLDMVWAGHPVALLRL
jgi:hypothetical protein